MEEVSRGRMRAKIKLKGKQLKEMQDAVVLMNYAIDKALQDCFTPQEIFELLDSARDSGYELERLLGV